MKLNEFKPPLVIGHRGYKARFPENTLVAFEAAWAAGAQMIELDVTLSRDRQPVVIHDDTLERTTNGRGPVGGLTLAELKTLDAGGWFHPRFAGERLPGLAEVLDRLGGRILINIEIKPSAFEAHQPPDAIERQVAALVQRKNVLDSVLVSSFQRRLLENIAGMGNPPALALISERAADRDTIEFCRRIGSFSWHPDYRTLDRRQVDRMHAEGIRVMPYTVNSPGDIQRVLKIGADGLFTDDPGLAERLICGRQDRPS